MYRKINALLMKWKNNPRRKPLILKGARQVGKTYSVLTFGREQYANVAYFNFETTPNLAKTFDESIMPDYLIPVLSRLSRQTIIKGKTLIVFDEVQCCERALASLKYFCESAPDYHIVAVGSQVGATVNRENFSFLTDKVDTVTLFPMDMEEFLLALGEKKLITQIRKCFETYRPMPLALHEAAMLYFRQYLIVGGMPGCVEKYIETKDLILVRHIQELILESYSDNIRKYNKESESKKIKLCYNNIIEQLSKKNTRFQYKLIKKGARSSEFESAVDWLTFSGYVTRVFRAERPIWPLGSYRDVNYFKIYVSDTGLLCAKKEIAAEDVLYQSAGPDYFKSGLTENYVCGQLTARGSACYYWMSSRGAEVDFIIRREGRIIPVEVKSADNTKAKSLDVYIKSFKPPYAIKLSVKNFGFENGKLTVPLYAAFCI